MFDETTIILAIIGMVGLFASATVFQRANKLSSNYYKKDVTRFTGLPVQPETQDATQAERS